MQKHKSCFVHSTYPILFRDADKEGRPFPPNALAAILHEYGVVITAFCREYGQSAHVASVHIVVERDADSTSVVEFRRVQTVAIAENECKH